MRALLLVIGLTAVPTHAATFYVRQTVGNDALDGHAPATAWRTITRLSTAMHAGDTVYVGPGLYREQVTVLNDGRADARITFVGDASGRHTGDPPGAVMVTGADRVDPSVFAPTDAPGVFTARLDVPVVGVVEMDGLQRRYRRARDTKEYLVDKISEVDVVGRLRSSWFWDEAAHVLRLHTSDDAPPASHEVELIHRGNGIAMTGIRHVTVMGFTFRHMGDAGVNFFKGSGDAIALHNTAYGCRQGIRVYGATRVRVAGNTLFRNDNSGVYFAAESSRGKATGNVAYENIKGLRWSSKSEHALAAGNVAFDNVEAGIALEEVKDALLSRNTLAANAGAQLLALSAAYGTERNCYETAGSPGLLADFVFGERYRTLAEYQQARHADLDARDGGCGPLPPKVDVRRIHADATVYAERARAQLAVR